MGADSIGLAGIDYLIVLVYLAGVVLVISCIHLSGSWSGSCVGQMCCTQVQLVCTWSVGSVQARRSGQAVSWSAPNQAPANRLCEISN